MSYYIIIRGPLGIGKSTIAKSLARSLNGKYFSMDDVLSQHRLDKVEGECIPAKNFIRADKIILPEIKDCLNHGRLVIIDGNFYHQEQIEHLVNSLKEEHYIFTLTAPLEVCIQRDAQRPKSYGSGAAQSVHNLVSRFDYGTTIQTEGKTAEQVLKEIKTHLPK